MLALAFEIARSRFALPCAHIVELVPRVALRILPKAPASVAGVFTYRGAIVPVIDLSLLLGNTESAVRLSTRIAVVNVSLGKSNASRPNLGSRGETRPTAPRMVGLLAERMFDTVVLDQKAAIDDGIHIEAAPYLGDVYLQGASPVQLLLLDRLFSGPLEQLFQSENLI
jgi:chemotaxis-related protein WspB